MREVLGISDPAGVHRARHDLQAAITAIDPEVDGGLQLTVANSMWLDAGSHFLPSFTSTIEPNYGAAARPIDFSNDPEGAREMINGWVSDQTNARIEDLLPEGSIRPLTRFVLANAIYFNANWAMPFHADLTEDAPFYRSDGSDVAVPMMFRSGYMRAHDGDGLTVVELPYVGGDTSMVILMPDDLETFESTFSPETLEQALGGLDSHYTRLHMPRFRVESTVPLRDVLMAMGMDHAFTDQSDFSGVDGTRTIYISGVFHKAFVSVDEEGTEAAAATAVVGTRRGVPPPPIEIDINKPFLFVIQHNDTGAVLFLGRVVDPS
jgi:serpin B